MKSKGFQGRREYPESRNIKYISRGLETPASWQYAWTRVEMDAGQSPLDRDLILLSIDQTRFATMQRFHVATLKQQDPSFVHFNKRTHTRHIVQLPILQSLTIISPMFQCTHHGVQSGETKRKFIPLNAFCQR